jgi:hypothetical protein
MINNNHTESGLLHSNAPLGIWIYWGLIKCVLLMVLMVTSGALLCSKPLSVWLLFIIYVPINWFWLLVRYWVRYVAHAMSGFMFCLCLLSPGLKMLKLSCFALFIMFNYLYVGLPCSWMTYWWTVVRVLTV